MDYSLCIHDGSIERHQRETWAPQAEGQPPPEPSMWNNTLYKGLWRTAILSPMQSAPWPSPFVYHFTIRLPLIQTVSVFLSFLIVTSFSYKAFTCLKFQPLPFVSVCNVNDGKERCQTNAKARKGIKNDPTKLADLNGTQDFCFAIHWRKAI